VNSIKLAQQLPGDFTLQDWQRLECELNCLLPAQSDFETVFDLADYVATQREDLEPPLDRSLAAWRNAQIFAGVRDCLAYAAGVEAHLIYREASFVELGLD
jgi:hypothetical protein